MGFPNKGVVLVSSAVEYINNFFEQLEVWEDLNNNQSYKKQIHKSILQFLIKSDKENAFIVYKAFFDAYWIGSRNEHNPFIELLDKLKLFEENAGQLISKQRDHYVHSVYVFILGLSIFAQNSNFRLAFKAKVIDNPIYKDLYKTKNEEFFYRWGIASLFHDIAYPMEITIKQINEYINFISNHSDLKSDNIRIKMVIDNIDDFNSLPIIEPSAKFSEEFQNKYPQCKSLNMADSIDLLAYKLNISLGVDIYETRESLINFAFKMQDESFIDHGYYSALIVLRWYHYLVQKSGWNPAYFYYPIVDSASAILLHNYYKNGLAKYPFYLGKLCAEHHPIAFLLILCDELQDWNRQSYGKLDKLVSAPIGFDIMISNEILEVIYKFNGEDEGNDYVIQRLKGVQAVLETSKYFPQKFELRLEKG
jgi:hypothetical protein